MRPEEVLDRAATLPRSPGVYQFLGEESVLYVGKAVDLGARVRSYAEPTNRRTRRMVRAAERIDYAVTETETQALLLEANLIKRHHPRYNVRLKDDKSYPVVQLTDHEFPRIEVTRDPDDSATVFGPFTDRGRVDEVVKAIRSVHGLRGCSDHKFAGRRRPCLDHDLGLCSAPCTGEIGPEAYAEDVEAADRYLSGDVGALTRPLEREMEAMVERRAFERAATLRDRRDAARALHEGQGGVVSDAGEGDLVDVLGVAVEGEEAVVARLHSDRGKLVDRERHRLAVPDDGRARDGHGPILAAFISQYYAERRLPDVILVPEEPGDARLRAWLDREGVSLRVPAGGREATLVDLALRNASRSADATDAVGALAEALDLPRPDRIEGFDVSHAQGRAAVGSDVLFVDGRPAKAGYRRKRLEEGNDDVGNLRSLLGWRARRAIEGRDDRPDPDLLLIDGGKAQLGAAVEAIEAEGWSIPAIGLAKADETVVTRSGPVGLADDDPALHLLQRVRDEAHRFAVQYHQTLRDDVSSALGDVPGIGGTRQRELLTRFGSLEAIRAASPEELRSVPGIGPTTVRRLREHLG